MPIKRVILYDELRNAEDLVMLESVGQIVVLSRAVPMPSFWSTENFALWAAKALRNVGYNSETDAVALVGTLLAISQVIQVITVQDHAPYSVTVLAFSKAENRFAPVVLKEGTSSEVSIHRQ
jgi:hypothetical protein